MEWNDKSTVKKGNIGEEIVKEVLEQQRYVVYGSLTEGCHAFDFLAIKDKREFLIAEIKSKARLNKYAATGIDIRHFEEYQYIMKNKNIDVVLFFVDEHPSEERIYCQKLSVLSEKKTIGGVEFPNTSIVKGIILFSLSDMINVKNLNESQLHRLKEHSTRNYQYVTT